MIPATSHLAMQRLHLRWCHTFPKLASPPGKNPLPVIPPPSYAVLAPAIPTTEIPYPSRSLHPSFSFH